MTVISAGLTTGAVYALIAYGYNIVFATTGVLNFAHGQIFMVGMMLAAVLYGGAGWPLLPAIAAAIVVGGVIGVAEDKLALAPLRRRTGGDAMGWVLSTLGVAILIQSLVSLIYGPRLRGVPAVVGGGPVDVLGLTFERTALLIVVVAAVTGLLLHLFYTRLLIGRALGAVEQDADAAALRGVPVALMAALAFGLGSGLAALTGFLTASLSAASPTVGLIYGLKGFVVAAAGGIPSIAGATLAGLLIGVLEQATGTYIGNGYQNAVVFAALLLVLMMRPAGIFGVESIRAV